MTSQAGGRGNGLGRLLVVAGPTGAGKSDLAVAVAEQVDGEVINADSMQLYRGMDIGTAKLTEAERHGVPHHLQDVLEVTETASVAAYQRQARAAIEDVLARGRTPLLVGGSGLYLQAVIDEMFFPGTDPAIRARLQEKLDDRGVSALWQELADRDPAAAAAIQQRNGRRIVRALEVIELTGRPFTAIMPTLGAPRYDAAMICLDRDTVELDGRLSGRVDAMIAAGFLAEVRALDAVGLRHGMTASRALGYRQLLGVLDGTATEVDAITSTVTATRRFVRRQRSWFRRDQRLHWLDAADTSLLSQTLKLIRS